MLERALRHQVDWVIIVSGMYLHPDWIILLRRAHVKTALLLTESPYDDAKQAKIVPFVDVVFTNERTSVPTFRALNDRVYYLPHAYDPSVHFNQLTSPRDEGGGVPSHDVVFVGTGFYERIELLRKIDWTGINFGLYGNWDWLGSRNKLRKYLRGGVQPNPITAALYRNAKIGLNLYRESEGFGKDAPRISHAESLSPRSYELAACGVFTLSSYREESREIFGDAIPMYRSPKELEELIREYLANESARIALASTLPGTVGTHTYANRAEVVTDALTAFDMQAHYSGQRETALIGR